MSPRINNRTSRSRVMLAVLAAVTLLAALVGYAAAVHDDNLFELGPAQSANILGDDNPANGPDWGFAAGTSDDGLFGSTGNLVGLPAAGVAAGFIADPTSQGSSVDATTFSGAGGSNKNNDAISDEDAGAPGSDTWHWDAGNVPAKDDLTNVYAYAALNASNELIIYAGFERLAAEGDSHVDIEFFEDPVALDEASPCNDPGSDETPCHFTGVRTDGDIVVSMDFLQGGGIGSVTVREWDASLEEYVQIGVAAGEGCNVGDTICAFNNGAGIDGGPWPNFNRHGAEIANLPANAFTEFGINLTALEGGTTPCLSTLIGKTRSSQSFTAELKDFAGPTSFPICGAQIAIAPDDVNEVGQLHTFTVTVDKKLGAQTSPALDGTIVTVTLTGDPDNVVDTCASPGTVNGTCSVTFTSDTAGVVIGHAAADVDIGIGDPIHVETDGTGTNSGDAVKRFVNARISIGPDDTNSVGESHTFTVTVQQDDGLAASALGGDAVTGFGPAPDGTQPAVTLTDSAGAVSNISSNTCANPGTTGGTCAVTFTSNTAGTVTGHASITFGVGGLSLTRQTDGTGGNSGDATKIFAAGELTWVKRDNAGQLQGGATFEVCRTHNFNTQTMAFDDIADICLTVVDDVDGVAGGTLDEDADPGEFKLSGLVLGRYTVRETVAPPGFVADPDTVTVELTLPPNNVKSILEAFVNNRPIVKITAFGYTNVPAGTPTSGVLAGTTTYTVTVKNFGGASTDLSNSSLAVSVSAGTISCTGGNTLALTGSLAPSAELAFTLVCPYSLTDGAEVTADLNVKYTTNGLERTASGSPARIMYTVQGD